MEQSVRRKSKIRMQSLNSSANMMLAKQLFAQGFQTIVQWSLITGTSQIVTSSAPGTKFTPNPFSGMSVVTE
jgi:hypothetical protein